MKLYTATSLIIGSLLFTTPASAGWLDNLASSKADTTKAATATQGETSDLVGSVMSQLGLNQQQAEGGLGSLLGLAKTNLDGNDFSTLTNSIPNADGLLAAVPSLDSSSGMSGLLSKAGDLGSSLQGSAMVYDAFEKLGISKDLVAPMIDIAKNYLESSGSEGTVDLLAKGLGSLL